MAFLEEKAFEKFLTPSFFTKGGVFFCHFKQILQH